MADRYDERHRQEYGSRQHYDEERGMVDRAGDEVRSWFGEEDAARRRQRDERERDSTREYQRRNESNRSVPRWSNALPSGLERHGWRSGESDRRDDVWRSGRRDPRDRHGAAFYMSDSRMHFGGDDGGAYGRSSPKGGVYAGRGPKGYRRSDDRMREDVCDQLTDDPMIDASDIEVSVRTGEVTLSGFVREREDKRRAEEIAERISGVREVHNSLRLTRDETSTHMSDGATGTADGGTTGMQQSER